METFLTTTTQVLSVVHLVSALLASGHVVLSHPQARGASLWLGLIWLVPWLGPLLYVLVGINRIPRRARGRIPAFEAVTPWMPNSRLRCLVGGDEAYSEMIAAIDLAQKTVHLQSYIFDNDRAGELFCQAFERAIGRGVVVRVLIDAVGASYSRPTIVGKLKKIGVEVARFMSTSVPWRWQYANMRNHRKLMVVDGTRAFFGGMNIREGCMDSLSPANPTLDIHFQVEGPIITSLISLFSGDWMFATGQALPSPEPWVTTLETATSARLVHCGPDRTDEPIRWLKLAAVVRARYRVRIMTPYFVPDEDVVTALLAAMTAGVKIQIVMPSQNNLRLVAWASRACWGRLIARGAEIVLSPPPFEHSKMMLIDDDLAIVGSANWDERSFRLNFEADIECSDRELVRRMDAMIDVRIADVLPVTLEDLANDSLPVRLRDGTARLALPYL